MSLFQQVFKRASEIQTPQGWRCELGLKGLQFGLGTCTPLTRVSIARETRFSLTSSQFSSLVSISPSPDKTDPNELCHRAE
ncbi:MAG: hypothetical protein R2742_05865 [Micropruina glycogenica]